MYSTRIVLRGGREADNKTRWGGGHMQNFVDEDNVQDRKWQKMKLWKLSRQLKSSSSLSLIS